MTDTIDPSVDAFDVNCAGRLVYEHVTSRWGLLILVALRAEPLRFYLLRDRIGGISEKMLSQNLQTLTEDGLIRREVEPSKPPKVVYSLTDLGVELADHLQTLVDWIRRRTPDVLAARATTAGPRHL